MKIVYLHQYFCTPRMAGGTRSYEMARRLVRRGHEVHVVTSMRRGGGDRPADWHVTEEDGITVHWIPVSYSNTFANRDRIKAFGRFAWRASARAAALDGDLVFATSTPLTIAIPGVYAARRRRVPMVFEVRDLWPELPVAVGALRNPVAIAAARRLERFAYGNAARVVALSPGMRDGVVATGYPAERVSVIPNSCDLDLFDVPEEVGQELRAEHPWLGSRPLVVYTGTLGAINGVDYLARVAAEVLKVEPEVRFVVVGDGIGGEKTRETAQRLGVADTNFFMLGRRPKTEIARWLSAADLATSLFIDLPAMWHNSANKFFDALAAGRPVAINYGGWQAEILRDSGAGITLPATDAKAAGDALAAFVTDREALRRARSAAKRLAAERFSRDRLALDFEKVLLDAVR